MVFASLGTCFPYSLEIDKWFILAEYHRTVSRNCFLQGNVPFPRRALLVHAVLLAAGQIFRWMRLPVGFNFPMVLPALPLG